VEGRTRAGRGRGPEGREGNGKKGSEWIGGRGGGEGEWGSPPTIFALKVALFCCLSYSL